MKVEQRVGVVVPKNYDLTEFSYKVLNRRVTGTLTTQSETKSLLYESDVKVIVE